MKSPTQHDTADLDTILSGDGSSLPPTRAASLPPMIRDYHGFGPGAGAGSRNGHEASSRDFRVGSILPPGLADAETVWPGAPSVWHGARPGAAAADRPAPAGW